MRVLGLETSCDETAVAVYDRTAPACSRTSLYSQVDLHALRGVVPELASRDHLRKLLPLLRKVVEAGAGRARSRASPTPAARGSWARCWWARPWRAVWPTPGGCPAPAFITWKPPARAPAGGRPSGVSLRGLLVSGGHTLLARVEAVGRYEILGASLDDAPGRRSTRRPKLLGLGYPGGPQLAVLAERGRPDVFRFSAAADRVGRPRPRFQLQRLKTAVVVALRGRDLDEQTRADAARAFERRGRGHARHQVSPRARGDRRADAGGGGRRGGQPPAARRMRAWARVRTCGRLPARGVLHRQRGDDRPARTLAPVGRPHDDSRSVPGPLAHVGTRAPARRSPRRRSSTGGRPPTSHYPPSPSPSPIPHPPFRMPHGCHLPHRLTSDCIIGHLRLRTARQAEASSTWRWAPTSARRAASDAIDDTLDTAGLEAPAAVSWAIRSSSLDETHHRADRRDRGDGISACRGYA